MWKTTQWQVIYERLTSLLTNLEWMMLFISKQNSPVISILYDLFYFDDCLDVAGQSENQVVTIVNRFLLSKLLYLVWFLQLCFWQFSMNFHNWSELFPGQSSVVMLILFKKSRMTFDQWHGAPSCINIMHWEMQIQFLLQ